LSNLGWPIKSKLGAWDR